RDRGRRAEAEGWCSVTEETPGYEQQPDVPADAAQPDDAAAQAAGQVPVDETGAPADTAGDVTETEQEGQEVLQGQVQDQGQDPQIAALTAQLDQTRTALHERTQDLQRLQAEFQNYRRRVERDRATVKEVATANLLTELLP